ncbi:unnamed protein product [marine sediment metagenome]|uniref:Uncharacterized protein n=1 Tax=marine sediment metagenome TaxID=412755 RepID=X1NVC1_9ZZZZ
MIEKTFPLIQSDKELENEFKQFLKGREIFKFVKDTIENSQARPQLDWLGANTSAS